MEHINPHPYVGMNSNYAKKVEVVINVVPLVGVEVGVPVTEIGVVYHP
jgi:hypothetical protein